MKRDALEIIRRLLDDMYEDKKLNTTSDGFLKTHLTLEDVVVLDNPAEFAGVEYEHYTDERTDCNLGYIAVRMAGSKDFRAESDNEFYINLAPADPYTPEEIAAKLLGISPKIIESYLGRKEKVPVPFTYKELEPLTENVVDIAGAMVDLTMRDSCDCEEDDVWMAGLTLRADNGVGIPIAFKQES
jgi:hypothetical protein